MKRYLIVLLIVVSSMVTSAQALKVFILAGQSNMEGFGVVDDPERVGSLEWVVNTPSELWDNFPNLVDDDGNWNVLDQNGDWAEREDAWIYYRRLYDNADINNHTELSGGISTGYGFRNNTIGPEFGFGHVMGEFLDEQVLIIKVAWGGRSLYNDFLSPGVEDYPVPQVNGDKGFMYKRILDEVEYVFANLSTLFPDYDGDGYEIAGFGWHQGWNDGDTDETAAAYEDNMIQFIKDIRSDLQVPDLPFVIALTGLHGYETDNLDARYTRLAHVVLPGQLAAAEASENTLAVETRPFWRTVEIAPFDAQYHWNNSGESYFLIGNGMGETMKVLLSVSPVAPSKSASGISIRHGTILITARGPHVVGIKDMSGKLEKKFHGVGPQQYSASVIKQPGVYFIRVETNKGVFHRRIVRL